MSIGTLDTNNDTCSIVRLFDALPCLFNVCIQARLVHGEDISSAAAFTVDPDMRHVYVGYGRGTLAQMERRRLMAGTPWNSFFCLRCVPSRELRCDDHHNRSLLPLSIPDELLAQQLDSSHPIA